jgi:flavodoxin
MTDVAEGTTKLQNAVRSFLSAMEPEEIVAFASLVYFYNGRHDVRYNGRILCARVAKALVRLVMIMWNCGKSLEAGHISILYLFY